MTRLPNAAHTAQPWRIHEIAGDFAIEDVWALPTPGGPDDFDRLLRYVTDGDPARGSSFAARVLFAVRWKIGALLGWDGPEAGVGGRVVSLRDRLPDDLRAGPAGPRFGGLPFEPLYRTEREYAAEIANRTVHGVLHLGWVPDGNGGYRGQLAVLVRRNGLLGRVYMAAINPVRHVLVYPAMMRTIGRRWRSRPA